MKRSNGALICLTAAALFGLAACQSEDIVSFGKKGPAWEDSWRADHELNRLSSSTASNSGGSQGSAGSGGTLVAQWVRVAIGASEGARFWAVTQDEQENVYAVGEFQLGRLDLDDGVSVHGVSTNHNPLIAKYDSAGKVLWARSAEKNWSGSLFTAVAVDKTGNAYAIGTAREFDFGNGVRSDEGRIGSSLLVKFDSEGMAKWALAASGSDFNDVAVGPDGNIFLAGSCWREFERFTREAAGFKPPSTATGKALTAMLVKVDPSGNAIWATSAPAKEMGSSYQVLAIDEVGNMYAAGSASGQGTIDLGNGVVVAGPGGATLATLVKYDSSGIAQWARTATVTTLWPVLYRSIVQDGRGGVYIAGDIQDKGIADFGNGVQVQTTSINANAVLVKYNSRGEPLWAKALRDDVRRSGSIPLAIDSMQVYVSSAVLAADGKPKDEAFLTAYDFAGNARVVPVAHGISPRFMDIRAIHCDDKGDTVLAGDSFSSLDLGNGIRKAIPHDSAFVAKYKGK